MAALLGVPWTVTAHAADLFVPRPGLGELLRSARAVVTVAEHHRRWLSERHGVQARVVRCGVDPAFFSVSPAQPSDPLRVVCVARRVAKKGIDALEAAVAGDPRFRLRVVDAARPDDVPGILAESHVFALAARVAGDGDRDGVPVALLEALAAGLPVIATELVDADRLDRPVLDVRQDNEHAAGHLPDALHVELGDVTEHDHELPDGDLAVMCGHGERAATAASLLERAGRHDVAVVIGGPGDWAVDGRRLATA